MFHRSNPPALTLAMLLTIAAISKSPAAAAHSASPLEPTKAVLAPTSLIAGISSPLDSNQTIADETQSTSADQVNQFPESEQQENTWVWYIISLIGLSLLVGRVKGYQAELTLFMEKIKTYRATKSPIAVTDKAVPLVPSDSISQVLRQVSVLFANNTRSVSQASSNTVLTGSLISSHPDPIADPPPLAPEIHATVATTDTNSATDKLPADIVPETHATAVATDTARSDNSSIHQIQKIDEDCQIVIQPLLSAKVNTPQSGTTQPQAVIRWTIPVDRKLALQRQGGKTLVLRVLDATNINLDRQPAHSFRQYYCEESAVDMIIPILNIDRDYVAEIGYLTQDGLLLRLAQSAK